MKFKWIWMRYFGMVLVTVSAAACASEEGRWYSDQQIVVGQQVFKQNCAACHGEQAQGTLEWRKRDANGNLPPPPLNGAAHAWHHPMSVLLRTIERGGVPLGGTMPAFANQLVQEDRLAAIAYFQDFWSDEIYRGWVERGGLK